MKITSKKWDYLFLILFLILISQLRIYSQTQVFFDDFSSGTSKWILTGNWGLSATNYHSSANSITESPAGDYTNMQNTSATSIDLNLTSYLGAELSFWGKYDLENSFDYMYLEISKNGGSSYIELTKFTGSSPNWTKYTYNIGGFVGSSNVKIRFRFYSDQNIVADGMYIDDIQILGTNIDNSAPLIIHQPPAYYEGTQDNYDCIANITDISGVNSAILYYFVDGAGPYSETGFNSNGDQFSFTIPSQTPGSLITYKIIAADNANPSNQTDIFDATNNEYISGNYISYDDGQVDNIATITGTSAAAVKITIPSGQYGRLVSALVRNYTDSEHSNSNMLFHVWDNNNGTPGNDMISPFYVTPEATLNSPFPFTRIDLRNYSNQLSDLTGDIFVGFTVPSNSVNVVISSNSHSRSYTYNGTNWASDSKDFEFRAILNLSTSPLPVELTSFKTSVVNNYVELKWETATEVNNYGFEIERLMTNENNQSSSVNSNWTKVGFVNGNGNSNSPKFYSFVDKTLSTVGRYLYKIKQIDNDGRFEYSKIKEVNFNSPLMNSLNQNYPNPFNPSTTIEYTISKSSFVSLEVYDILGEVVETLVNQQELPGIYKVQFNGSGFANGVYFYRIQADEFVSIKKLLLLK